MKKIFIIPVLFTIILLSCEKNFNVEIPVQEPKIVIGFTQQTGEPLSAKISKSQGILVPPDPANPNASFRVTQAQVLVYENNIFLDSLTYSATDKSYITLNNKQFTAGNNYRVTALAPGLNRAEAFITAPRNIAINSISRVRNARNSSSGDPLDDLTISFNDAGNETNYYLIRVLKPNFYSPPVSYTDVACIYTSDVDIEKNTADDDPFDPDNCISPYNNSVLMRDNNFNGRTKQIKISVYSSELTPGNEPVTGREWKPVFELWHISEPEYKYKKSRQAYESAIDNPFAEPVQIYSNILNGYGIFGIHSIARDSIR